VQRKYTYNDYINSTDASAGAMLAVGGIAGVAGAVAGGALVGKLGAAIGTAIAPGLGTAIGAAAGVVIGGGLALLGVDVARELTPTDEEITRKETGMGSSDYKAFLARAAEEGLTYSSGTTKEEY
jgi:hypothetical protein